MSTNIYADLDVFNYDAKLLTKDRLDALVEAGLITEEQRDKALLPPAPDDLNFYSGRTHSGNPLRGK